MLGFDWVTHKNDPQAANDNMGLSGLLPPSVDALRDRFDMVEGLSGGNLNDVLRGDDDVVADQLGNELDQAGIDMVAGLAGLLGGQTSFTGGNIIIGGEGSDQIEGRGGNDLIDGDAWFNVQLSAGGQLYDSLNSPPVGATGQSLRERVFAGTVDPGTIEIVRSIVASPGTGFNDIATFTGPRSEYTIAGTPSGLTVTHTGGTTLDGVDTLRNIERLRFADGIVVIPTVNNRVPAANATGVAPAANITATFSEPVNGVSTQTFAVRPTSAPASAPIAGTVTRNGTTNTWVLNPTANLAAATQYTVTLTGGAAAIRNVAGLPLATTSWNFTTAGDTIAPTVTNRTPAANATGVQVGANVNATFSEAVANVTPATFTLRNPAGAVIQATVTRNGTTNTWILNPTANLARNTVYTVTLTGGAGGITDMASPANALAGNVTWTFRTLV
jgi:methionine-rich copper-binding protein CopC